MADVPTLKLVHPAPEPPRHPRAARAPRRGPARVISIGGGKGGIGKSLIAANLGIELARRGKRVVLVDADLGGANLHTTLGVDVPRRTLSDFIERRVSRHRRGGDADRHREPGAGLRRARSPRRGEPAARPEDAAPAPRPAARRGLRHPRPRRRAPIPTSSTSSSSPITACWCWCPSRRRSRTPTASSRRPSGGACATWPRCTATSRCCATVHGGASFRSPVELVETVSRAGPRRRRQPGAAAGRVPAAAGGEPGAHRRRTPRSGAPWWPPGSKYFGLEMDYLGYIHYDDEMWRTLRARRPFLVERPDVPAAKAFATIVDGLLALDIAGRAGAAPVKPLSQQTLYEILDVSLGRQRGDHRGGRRSCRRPVRSGLARHVHAHGARTRSSCSWPGGIEEARADAARPRGPGPLRRDGSRAPSSPSRPAPAPAAAAPPTVDRRASGRLGRSCPRSSRPHAEGRERPERRGRGVTSPVPVASPVTASPTAPAGRPRPRCGAAGGLHPPFGVATLGLAAGHRPARRRSGSAASCPPRRAVPAQTPVPALTPVEAAPSPPAPPAPPLRRRRWCPRDHLVRRGAAQAARGARDLAPADLGADQGHPPPHREHRGRPVRAAAGVGLPARHPALDRARAAARRAEGGPVVPRAGVRRLLLDGSHAAAAMTPNEPAARARGPGGPRRRPSGGTRVNPEP